MTPHAYGWRPDSPDERDHQYAAPPDVLANLPSRVDLREHCPPVYDQGQLGSCTANAIAAAVEFERRRQGLSDFVPSRLFIYWNERELEGNVDEDSGAELRDGIKVVAKTGAPPETDWPYDISKFTLTPPPAAFAAAKLDVATAYKRVAQTLGQMRGCLASGLPFVFGFTVYESFETDQVAQTGIAPMPGPNEQVLGGHAVMAVGYDDAAQRFLVRNSWGDGWGMQGYFSLQYAYLTTHGLASDLWVISQESGGSGVQPDHEALLTELVSLLRTDLGEVGGWLERHGL
jgi:C1A family cysteine protease